VRRGKACQGPPCARGRWVGHGATDPTPRSYIYKGDINKENFFYKCPVCDVGKNRFKKKEAR